jgi:hypothetical protein
MSGVFWNNWPIDPMNLMRWPMNFWPQIDRFWELDEISGSDS